MTVNDKRHFVEIASVGNGGRLHVASQSGREVNGSVTTFTNLPFRTANATLGGISSVSLTAVNIQPNLIDPKYPPLFDNIRIERKVGGVTILFR